MKENIRGKIGPFILLMYGVLVVYYYYSGLLAFLVNPIYNKLILTAGIILLLIGIHAIKQRNKVYHDHLQVSKSWKECISIFLLTLPLLFGALFKPQLLSSASAVARGVSGNLTDSTFDPSVFAKPTEERSLLEWIRILNVDPEPDHYKDQKVSMEGSIIMDEKLPKNTFYLGQFLLTCCAADARVVGIPVHFDPSVFQPIKDHWIKVNGVMGEGLIEERREVVVQLESAIALPTPQDAYEIFK